MATPDVLVVAGTHGNEVNAPWLIERWQRDSSVMATAGLTLRTVIGNPEARSAGRRYLDRDLNRSFRADWLSPASDGSPSAEAARARELLALHGPEGERPCQVAIDLHSTTAAMGNCLVVYGRRPADLALAALVQGDLGLPVYLHEADAAQTGFLVEAWPCGLVIEVGPVPQSVLDPRIVRQTLLALEACLQGLSSAARAQARYPKQLVVHRHLGSVDSPRDRDDQPGALLHQDVLGSDWCPLRPGQALFQGFSAVEQPIHPCAPMDGSIPVFVNEAAYMEKRIALSLTRREVWSVSSEWIAALEALMR